MRKRNVKRDLLAGTLSALALLVGASWSEQSAANAVSFEPPSDNAAPRETTGGASRSGVFTPPADNAAPLETTGGASRGDFFTPPADNAVPQETTGGASRGDFFTPPVDNAAPQETTGGASRGDFFTPPADNAAPQETTGGASRSENSFDISGDDSMVEPADSTSRTSRGNAYGVTYSETGAAVPAMLAVMPESFYGTTVEAHPTILVYVPQSDADEAVFSLKDESRNTVYETSVTVPVTGGILAIEMAEDAPALTVGENYQWYVAIKVEEDLSPSSPFVDGWVKRIELSAALSESLQQRDVIAQIKALGASGVWYDTVARLAKLADDRDDAVVANHWYELLESVGLDAIATAPIAI